MKRTLLLITLVLVATPGTALADAVSVSDLITDSAAHDAAVMGEITIEGELVGDFQRRGAWVWVQVNDDAYAFAPLRAGGDFAGSNLGVGARIPADLLHELGVTTPGGYRVRGPIVRLTGVWRHHDEARGGESYFDTTAIELLVAESDLSEGIRWWAMLTGLGLLAGSGSMLGVIRGRRKEAE